MQKELIADEKRQAVAPLGGYTYQIWQTVYKWINLKADEVLFLEGAEDIDVLGLLKSETIQVKHTKKSRTVTLRSKDVLDAISNFWNHRENNPESNIELHFLTTAERGKEKHSPFGQTKGLDYWDSCKFTLNDTTPLRTFLTDQDVFPIQLQQFLKDSKKPEFRERFIEKIVWNTGNKPKEYLKDLIERNICHHGDKLGIFPSESKKVIPHLLAYVLEVICKEKDRKLDYRDFLEVFEKATTQSIPGTAITHIREQEKLINRFLDRYGLPKSEADVHSGIKLQYLRPPLIKKIVRRELIVSKINKYLETNGLIVLNGSTGMGKSVLASLITSEKECDWQWLNLSGFDTNQIREILHGEAALLSEKASRTKLVLDDLNFDPQSNVYECALEGLLFAVLSLGGRIIITTRGEMPSRIMLDLGIPLHSVYNVPPFSGEEIRKLAIKYGCPQGDKLKSWSNIISVKTRGHPQLVHAYVKSLNSKKWPVVNINDITKEEDIESVRREARQSLIDQLPSNEARSFVYKLSMIKFRFRRDHAIELGQNILDLSNPGEIFDLLIGPWIERMNVDYYRISPLLDKAAEAIYGASQLKEINNEIAEVFISCQKLTLLEANVILVHGILGTSGGPIMIMLSSLLRAPEKHWKKIADEFWWITAIGIEKEKKIFPSDPFLNNFLRLFQFRISVETDSLNLAPRIANLWENELNYDQEPKLRLLDNIIFLTNTLMRYEVPFSQKVIISRIAKTIALKKEFEIIFKQPFFELDESTPHRSLTSSLILFSIVRCRNINDLNELLTSLGALQKKTRNEILSLLVKELDPSEMLANNVFSSELDSEFPKWNNCIKVLDRMAHLGLSWNIESLALAAYRTIAVIQDEQQNKSNDALKTLQKAVEKLGYEHPFLGNEKAIILYNNEHYKEAFKIWEEVLPKWPKDTVFLPIYQLPHVEDCAAILGNWNKVKEFALMGEDLAKKAKKSVMAVGFHAAYGFSLWKIRDIQGAIKTFADIMNQIPHLPDPNDNIHSYRLQKVVGHALAWMKQEASDQVQLDEPKPSWFTLQTVDERIRELPLQPTGLMWYFLAHLEYKFGSEKTNFKRLKKESDKLDSPFIHFIVQQIGIGYLLKDLKLKSLVTELKNWCETYEISLKHKKDFYGVFKKADSTIKVSKNELCSSFQHWLPHLLLVAITKFINRGSYANALLDDWKNDSMQSGFWDKKLEDWFKAVEDAPNMNAHELYTIMSHPDSVMRCLAALNLSAKKIIKPSLCFYANVVIVEVMKNSPWIEAVDNDIEQIISRNWLRVTSKQSFALKSPAVNSPLIIDACKDQSKGLKKAAKILLAAKDAVQISIPDQVMKDLKELSKASGNQIP